MSKGVATEPSEACLVTAVQAIEVPGWLIVERDERCRLERREIPKVVDAVQLARGGAKSVQAAAVRGAQIHAVDVGAEDGILRVTPFDRHREADFVDLPRDRPAAIL